MIEQKCKEKTILKILSDCARFYQENLQYEKPVAFCEYLRRKNIFEDSINQFKIGASLNNYDLPRFLLSNDYSRQDILDSGAVNEVNGELQDALYGRLIIPIVNSYDQIVAFCGRAVETTNTLKYKLTCETLVFEKKRTLYNINLLENHFKAQVIKEVIIVENFIDLIVLYQAGIKNIVSSMGTTITPEQARSIKRYSNIGVISFDGDSIGRKAALNAATILKNEGESAKIVSIPDGFDPYKVVQCFGIKEYRKYLESAVLN